MLSFLLRSSLYILSFYVVAFSGVLHGVLFAASDGFNGGLCDTRVRKPSTIQRTCTYTIDPAKIKKFIDDHPSITVADKTTMNDIANAPADGKSAYFKVQIKTLRTLSYSYTPGIHDSLYVFHPNSCRYETKYANNSICTNDADTYPPLIDKIRPTIRIGVTIGGDHAQLLDQESNSIDSSQSFLAGTGTINLDLFDMSGSSYSVNQATTNWSYFNGISGIKKYDFTIERTHNYFGESIMPILMASGAYDVSSDYNPTGAVTATHFISPTITHDNFKTAGKYKIVVRVLDAAGNINIGVADFTIIPKNIVIVDPPTVIDPTNPISPTNPFSTTFGKLVDNPLHPPYQSGSLIYPPDIIYTISGGTSGDIYTHGPASANEAYANNIDTNLYVLHIIDEYGNPVYNWNLYDFSVSASGIYLDGISKSGTSALWIDVGNGYKNEAQTATTDKNGNLFFRIKSYSPGEYEEQFVYTYKLWDRSRNELPTPIFTEHFPRTNIQRGEFFHIFTGAIEFPLTNRIDLGTNNSTQLGFFATSTTPTDISDFTVYNFLESLVSLSPDNFVITGSGFYNGFVTFSTKYPDPSYLSGAHGSFVPEQVGSLFTETLSIETWPYIELQYGDGVITKYFITSIKNNYGSGIVFGTGGLNRIYVEGVKRTTGKEGYVDVTSSIGSTNSADVRNAIHKNVAILLRSRASGSIVNRVKYVTGDQVGSTIDNDLSLWDTIVIKDGDLTIDADLNSDLTLDSIAHKGIIVLADDITGNGGNIYIKPNVQFIGATLFADESVFATDTTGTIFPASNSARTALLDKQLVFYGGVFSKNTVGGAVRANSTGQYVLPWKGTTTSLDEAVKYDLAFLRMDSKNPVSALNGGHSEFVVIMTDERNLSDPLPGFATIQQ